MAEGWPNAGPANRSRAKAANPAGANQMCVESCRLTQLQLDDVGRCGKYICRVRDASRNADTSAETVIFFSGGLFETRHVTLSTLTTKVFSSGGAGARNLPVFRPYLFV